MEREEINAINELAEIIIKGKDQGAINALREVMLVNFPDQKMVVEPGLLSEYSKEFLNKIGVGLYETRYASKVFII